MKKVMAVGFCRSGTLSMVEFFKALGVPSYHQMCGPGSQGMKTYDFLEPPDWAKNYWLHKRNVIMTKAIQGFECGWDFSYHMYGIDLTCRDMDIDWIIIMRNPENATNSLVQYRRNVDKVNFSAQKAYETYIDLYRFLDAQADHMPKKPRWMQFEAYIHGIYNESLFKLFDIPETNANMVIANNVLLKKINHRGCYDKVHDPELIFNAVCALDAIKDKCEEL